MPVYDYKCREHGLFYELATLEQSAAPVPCPHCRALSPRVILVAPDILQMPPQRKRAFETNERAANEPVHSTKARREEDVEHASGCGCTQHLGKSKLMYTARGEKMFPSMRPWMISH